MISRLINWITNPFKKEEKITLPNVAPLSSEVKNKLIADLIEVAKEFKEKKEVDLDSLPLTRVSNEVKEKIANLVKEDLKDRKLPNLEIMPILRIAKALGAIGFTVVRKTFKKKHKFIFVKNLSYLEEFEGTIEELYHYINKRCFTKTSKRGRSKTIKKDFLDKIF